MSDIKNPLDQSICFQLYVASKEIIRLYKPYLDNCSLTYTGFLAMIAIEDGMSVKELGKRLYLDSGTLSPLLKKLEKQHYITRVRSTEDERLMVLKLTPEGQGVRCGLPQISGQIYETVDTKTDVDLKELLQMLLQLNKNIK